MISVFTERFFQKENQGINFKISFHFIQRYLIPLAESLKIAVNEFIFSKVAMHTAKTLLKYELFYRCFSRILPTI